MRYALCFGLSTIVVAGFGQSPVLGDTAVDFPLGKLVHCFHAEKTDHPLDLDLTFMGSNQAVHPDVYFWENSFGPTGLNHVIGYNSEGLLDTIIASPDTPRWKYWMALTPYPYGNAFYENPTVRVSNEKDYGWQRPYAIGDDPTDGFYNEDTVWVRDPVTAYGQPNAGGAIIDPDTIWDEQLIHSFKSEQVLGHNSDPEFVYDSTAGMLYLVFRSYKAPDNREAIFAFKSVDGINWNQRDTLTVAENDLPVTHYYSPWNLISPTICRAPNGNYWLWTVDKIDGIRGTQMIRMEIPYIGGRWIKVDTCNVQIPIFNRQLWHMKIIQSPEKSHFYMLATLNRFNSTSYDTLGQHMFISRDGLQWTYFNEIIDHGSKNQWDYQTYRGTFLFEPSGTGYNLPVWYSGVTLTNVWGIGYAYVHNIDVPGDFNDDCDVNLLDILGLIEHIYGVEVFTFERRGDCNGDCRNNLLDILYLINYIYYNGAMPLDACTVK